MAGRRERLEFVISGGRPWGFSVKGGKESHNKPLIISKMERGGKAEASGLAIGDRLHSVNNVILSGVRAEAIQLIKMSGVTLTLEIERGASPGDRQRGHYDPTYSPQMQQRLPEPQNNNYPVQYHRNKQEYQNNPYPVDDGSGYVQNYQQPEQYLSQDSILSQNQAKSIENIPDFQYDHYTSNNSINQREIRHSNENMGNYRDTMDTQENASSVSSNRSKSRPLSSDYSSDHHVMVGTAPPLHTVSSEAVNNIEHNYAPSGQPCLRIKKTIRDKNFTKERPRSWHVSKHTEIDQQSANSSTTSIPTYNGSGMRSPSNSEYSPQMGYYKGHNDMNNRRRRSKGWQETEYLKSTVRSGLNDSKDSVISGDSYRVSRHSVSSSRSSGTMSSSRGSLDNLDNYNNHIRKNSDVVSDSNKSTHYASRSPEHFVKDKYSNVNLKKNMFEQLSSSSDHSRSSKENKYRRSSPAMDSKSERSSRTSLSPPSSIGEYHHGRQTSKSSKESQHSDESSFSPPQSHHNRYSRSHGYSSPPPLKPAHDPMDTEPSAADARLVKQTFDSTRGIVTEEVSYTINSTKAAGPPPPHRNSSSGRAVQQLSNPIRPQITKETSQLPYFPYGNNHHTAVVTPVKPAMPDIATHVSDEHKTVDEKLDDNKPRMFGVVAVNAEDGRKSIVTTSIAIPSSSSSPLLSRSMVESSVAPQSSSPQRYEFLKDAHTGQSAVHNSGNTDYVSREMKKRSKSSAQLSAVGNTQYDAFIRARPDRASGRYGEIWKTPQVHRRSNSTDAQTLLELNHEDGNRKLSATSNDVNKGLTDDLNYSIDQSKADLNRREMDAKSRQPIYRPNDGTNNVPESSSILKYLEHMKYNQTRKSVGAEDPKTTNNDNYLEIWKAGETKKPQSKSVSSPPPSNNKVFKKVDRDDDSYKENIKGMSNQVLRATSFTQKIHLTPTHPTKAPEIKRFEFPSQYTRAKPAYRHIKAIHARSRSVDNELEEGSEPITSGSSTARSETDNESVVKNISMRPKSAGSNKHEPRQRQMVIPKNLDKMIFNKKAGSLPRNYFASGLAEANLAALENERTEVKRPESAHRRKSSANSEINTTEVLKDYFLRKTGRVSTSGDERRKSHHSSEGLSSEDEVERKSTKGTPVSTKTNQSLGVSSNAQYKTSGPIRAKSTSSLIDAFEQTKPTKPTTPLPMKTSSSKSSSIENLTADLIPSHESEPRNHSSSVQSRLKLTSPVHHVKSPVIEKEPQHPILPPRTKRDRSSNASSTTTISTMSSYSSGSSASTGNTRLNMKASPKLEETLKEEIPVLQKQKSEEENIDKPRVHKSFNSNTFVVKKKEKRTKNLPEISSPDTGKDNKSCISELVIQSQNRKLKSPQHSIESKHSDDVEVKLTKSKSQDEDITMPTNHSPVLLSNIISSSTSQLPPPPPQSRLDEDQAKFASKKQSSIFPMSLDDLPPPPPPPPETGSSLQQGNVTTNKTQSEVNIPPLENISMDDIRVTGTTEDRPDTNESETSTSFSQRPQTYENIININLKPAAPSESSDYSTDEDTKENNRLIAKISEDLAPVDLTRHVIKNDQSLAPYLYSGKNMRDYMEDIMNDGGKEVEKKHRRRKKKNQEQNEESSPAKQCSRAPIPSSQLLVIPRWSKRLPSPQTRSEPKVAVSNLPASSTYYQTSASKAKILNLVQEKFAEENIDPATEENNEDENNRKKIELILSIKNKVKELQVVRDVLKEETVENEELGKELRNTVKQVCTDREQEKYNLLVQDINHIINLLLSLSSRLARVENALAMLSPDASAEEKTPLQNKRVKLTEQHDEAKILKENIDKRQKAVSDILACHLNEEQFADYEHYIKTKTALIVDQRELDDKMKLGDEQIQILSDSLPYEWQKKLEDVIEE